MEAMALALNSPNREVIRSIRDVLLFSLRDSMLGRWWNQFNTRGGFQQEATWRVQHEIFAPHDSPEIGSLEIDRLRNEYPSAFAWYEDSYFPNHVPVPIPRSIYYFDNQFRDGDAATR